MPNYRSNFENYWSEFDAVVHGDVSCYRKLDIFGLDLWSLTPTDTTDDSLRLCASLGVGHTLIY